MWSFVKKDNKDMVISSIKLWNVKCSKENTNPEKISMQYWRSTWLLYNSKSFKATTHLPYCCRSFSNKLFV